MRKLLLLAAGAALFMSNRANAQTIMNFEDGTTNGQNLNVMANGDWDDPGKHAVTETFSIIDNPDKSGINYSNKVMKFTRRGTAQGGMPWGGFWSNRADTLGSADVTNGKYVHIKVWKSRISPVRFKLEGGAAGTLEQGSTKPVTQLNQWVDVVFDFTSKTGKYPIIAFMPDFQDPLTLTDSTIIYFDDMRVNNDSMPEMPMPIPTMAMNFEDGTTSGFNLNVMGNGDWDDKGKHAVEETFMVINNPDKSGINKSDKVLQFVRRGTSQGGMPWGGFWTNRGDGKPAFDFTVNKYVHVKVWKGRTSPVKFKIEGGTTGTVEVASMSPQTETGKWVDMVFNYSNKTGTCATIVCMPDFEDPFTKADSSIIYIDDIRVSADSMPETFKPFGDGMLLDCEDGTTNGFNMNVMGNGEWDDPAKHAVSETFQIINNPSKTGINQSEKVMRFLRRGKNQGGMPWGGFWANRSDGNPSADVTVNKYVHVKVWKGRISPIKLKLEGGAAGTLEAPSTAAQPGTNMWVDMVYDFTSKTGTYPILAFMPDFEDPLTQDDSVYIYFDEIRVNNNPNPEMPTGINAISKEEVSVFPNPTTGLVYVNGIQTSASVKVINLVGKEVINTEINANGTIDMSSVPAGIYMLVIENANGAISTKKVIKN
ncbi:MAG: T9SS type A sorting domain-containing protein [Bacteroidia bacterium]